MKKIMVGFRYVRMGFLTFPDVQRKGYNFSPLSELSKKTKRWYKPRNDCVWLSDKCMAEVDDDEAGSRKREVLFKVVSDKNIFQIR